MFASLRAYKRTCKRNGSLALMLVVLAMQGCGVMSIAPEAPVINAISRPGSETRQRPVPVEESAKTKNGFKDGPAPITGDASWYGPGFVGRKTASGAIFDDAKLTAAHKTIPLGSRAKVTNLKNGKTIEVEINDRGPYIDGRILDLSHAAARALDMVHVGVTRVQIELLQ
jgi:rare lipoprotein A